MALLRTGFRIFEFCIIFIIALMGGRVEGLRAWLRGGEWIWTAGQEGGAGRGIEWGGKDGWKSDFGSGGMRIWFG